MLSRESLYKRLIYLVNDAKFAFWPDENKEDNKGYEQVVRIPGWAIAWYSDNNQPLPSLEQLNALDDSTVNNWFEAKGKEDRDAQKVKDLAIIATYKIEMNTNPNLTFRDYLDNLEKMSDSIAKSNVNGQV
jgi:hypothetical protein